MRVAMHKCGREYSCGRLVPALLSLSQTSIEPKPGQTDPTLEFGIGTEKGRGREGGRCVRREGEERNQAPWVTGDW